MEEFNKIESQNKFVESCEVFATKHGLHIDSIKKCMNEGKVGIIDIDCHGAELVRKYKGLNPLFVYILPPNLEELEKRIRGRATETEEQIQMRLKSAPKEIEIGTRKENPIFDIILVNDNLEECVAKIEGYIHKLLKRPFAPKIFLEGVPGAGKSTIGDLLFSKFGIVPISTGQLLRDLIKKEETSLSKKVKEYMEQGKLVPAELMQDIVVSRLRQEDCIFNGFCLDGYPPSVDDLQNLTKSNIQPDYVLCFKLSDEVAIQRQCSRGQRSTDNLEKAKIRVEIYHKEIPDIHELGKNWYPGVPCVKIDAEKSKDEVALFIEKMVHNWMNKPQSSYIYFPSTNELKSSRHHIHIDANNSDELVVVIKEHQNLAPQYQGQLKTYPIEHLLLGPQVKDLDNVYKRMMNFHTIESASDQEFITGRLGDKFDPNFMLTVLKAIKNTGYEYMTEYEEYTGEWTLKPDGKIHTGNYRIF